MPRRSRGSRHPVSIFPARLKVGRANSIGSPPYMSGRSTTAGGATRPMISFHFRRAYRVSRETASSRFSAPSMPADTRMAARAPVAPPTVFLIASGRFSSNSCSLEQRPTPERCVEAFHLQRTRFEMVAERKLRRRQLTDDGNVEITGRDLREKIPPAGQSSLFKRADAQAL